MSTVQLPVSILPQTPHPQHQGVSPLAQFLSSQMSSGGGSLNYNQVEPVSQACLAIAAAYPFDPNEVISYTRAHETYQVGMLEAVLGMTNGTVASHTYRNWPSDAAQFNQALLDGHNEGQSRRVAKVDTEWVAAVLLAAGADPWTPQADRSLPKAVMWAALHGMGGLLDRFLEAPGAWPAQQVADAQFVTTGPHGNLGWRELVSRPERACALDVLLKKGARPSSEELLEELLGEGHFEALKILAPYVSPLRTPVRQAVEDRWLQRSKELGYAGLPAEQLGELAQVFFGNSADPKLSAATVAIGQDLSVAWGSAANGSLAKAYGYQGDMGVEALLGRGQVRSGAMAGQWSRLASAVFARVRQAGFNGALGWDIAMMIHRKFEQGVGWVHADVTQPPFKGALEEALGFEWRPGVKIDSLVMLGLLGQDPEDFDADRLEKFAAATGVDDVMAWAREHVAGAVEATKIICSGNASTAATQLLRTWGALGVHTQGTGVLEALDEQQRCDLLYALTCKFKSSDPWALDSKAISLAAVCFDSLSKRLFPRLLAWDKLLAQDPTSILCQVALMKELALYRSPDRHGAVFAALGEVFHDLPERVLDMAEAWVKTSTSMEAIKAGEIKAQVKNWRLEKKLAVTGEQPISRPRPRM